MNELDLNLENDGARGLGSSLEPLTQPSTAERAAQQLREAILRGRFEPGARMNEAKLASELHVSRAPVREAFQRLIQEGLLRGERNKGVFVVSLESADSRDIYFVRSAIERAAAVAVGTRGDERMLAELDARVEHMWQVREHDWRELVDVDLDFHRCIVDFAGSPRLSRIFDSLAAETRLCLVYLEHFRDDRADWVRDHRVIAEAIRGGDRAVIEAVMAAHSEDAAARVGSGNDGQAATSGAGQRG